ncbi:MAG: nucleotide exchange factor GrpE [Nocardioides sp.]
MSPESDAEFSAPTGTDGGPEETPAPPGSFGDAAGEMANETEVEPGLATEAPSAGDPVVDELTTTRMALAERTADLQRLQAEYVNFKRRVDRDRDLTRENSKYAVLLPIIDVLDTIDRARAHGPLEDGFKSVAEQLERVVVGQGLAKFGEPGDPFDPTRHEALSHVGEDPEVEVTTCKVIAKAGYRFGERVVRAAQVLVVDPASPQRDEPAAAADTDTDAGMPEGVE